MARWLIYYEDGTAVVGSTPEEWRAAPNQGVQVVVSEELPPLLLYPGNPNSLRQAHFSVDGVPIRDRLLWTGQDVYDPFGWGKKHGSLISDIAYNAVWRLACGYH